MEQEEKIIRKPPRAFLKVDMVIQSILGTFVLLTLVVYPIAILLLIPFGAWQVLSGIIGALFGSKWRMIYLGIVIAYFSTYSFSDLLGKRSSLYAGVEFTLMTIYIATPLILGIGYYWKTRKEASQKEDMKVELKNMDGMEDILDANI